jgi:hypothetical protein
MYNDNERGKRPFFPRLVAATPPPHAPRGRTGAPRLREPGSGAPRRTREQCSWARQDELESNAHGRAKTNSRAMLMGAPRATRPREHHGTAAKSNTTASHQPKGRPRATRPRAPQHTRAPRATAPRATAPRERHDSATTAQRHSAQRADAPRGGKRGPPGAPERAAERCKQRSGGASAPKGRRTQSVPENAL